MFAPVGYTPLSMLWDQFIDKRIDAIYLSAANYYSNKKFDCAKVRGSPLDIAEHLFLELMWKCWVHAATPDGQLTRLHSRFDDHTTGLFTKQAPYTSVWGAAMTEVEMGNRDAIEKVAGPYFEEWTYEPEESGEWANTYPELKADDAQISEDQFSKLRFHTLPICFERESFMVVETLPVWSRLQRNKAEAELLVRSFLGRALCVPDEALEGWDKILSGETPTLQEDLLRSDEKSKPLAGRPRKIPRVVAAYKKLYPDGHDAGLKVVLGEIEEETGESVSERTLRRAINLISGSSLEEFET